MQSASSDRRASTLKATRPSQSMRRSRCPFKGHLLHAHKLISPLLQVFSSRSYFKFKEPIAGNACGLSTSFAVKKRRSRQLRRWGNRHSQFPVSGDHKQGRSALRHSSQSVPLPSGRMSNSLQVSEPRSASVLAPAGTLSVRRNRREKADTEGSQLQYGKNSGNGEPLTPTQIRSPPSTDYQAY